jgi:hypothetical protein
MAAVFFIRAHEAATHYTPGGFWIDPWQNYLFGALFVAFAGWILVAALRSKQRNI